MTAYPGGRLQLVRDIIVIGLEGIGLVVAARWTWAAITDAGRDLGAAMARHRRQRVALQRAVARSAARAGRVGS